MMRTAVLGVLVLVSAFAGASPAVAGGGSQAAAVAPEDPDFSSVHFTITVHADGSARWTFQYRTPLTNESQRENFRAFASEFENQTLPLYDQFRERARTLVSRGENVTDRSMRATDFTRSASITGLNDNLGVVEMSFTWTNFADVNGDRVVVGDLFEGGLYIGPDQRLILRAGPSLRFVSVSPDPSAMSGASVSSSDTVTWFGTYEFTDEHPHAVLTTAPLATSTPGTEANPTDAASTTTVGVHADQSSGFPWFGVTALVVLGALGGGILWWRRHQPRGPERTEPAGAEVSEPTPEPAVSDAEMLSDEDRVHRLLEDHGGRMRQVQIVDQTDWSKSKVSMLLSDMEDAGDISRMRIGRENIVSLPGHEPDVTRDANEDSDT